MKVPQTFYLGIGALILAIFVPTCAFWKPKGPQPAAFGHLQTLADLIDTWPQAGEKMFWGQKEMSRANLVEEDILHAGTATKRLEPVRFGESYMDLYCNGE